MDTFHAVSRMKRLAIAKNSVKLSNLHVPGGSGYNFGGFYGNWLFSEILQKLKPSSKDYLSKLLDPQLNISDTRAI